MHIHINNKGVTLIELMIAMFITAIIMAALIGLLNTQRKGYIAQQSRAECEESVSRIHGELLDKIRIAGYMIPTSFAGIQPYNVAGGADSIKVTGNYDNFMSESVLSIGAGNNAVYTKDSPRYRFTEGMKMMIVTPPREDMDTFWAEVDTAVKFNFFGTKYILFHLNDSTSVSFPSGSRISTFNEFVYKVGLDIDGSDTIKYFGVKANDETEVTHLVDGIEDIQLTYETRIDTTDHDTFAFGSLGNIYAVNLFIETRAQTADRRYIHPIYGDNYRRADLYSQVVVMNVALEK